MHSSVKLLFCFAAVMMAYSSSAQFLDYGVDPMRYGWSVARLPHYKLIYPRGLDSLAYRYALYLENSYGLMEGTGGRVRTSGFPVVLHPGAMSPNGMVAWAPRRMELLTTPSARHHSEPWEQHLTVHDARHVLQMGKMARGFFRPFYYLLGEQVAGLSAALVPRWYFEGDAVCAETGITLGGRGRLPEFQMIYRAQMLGGKFFSFDKWHLGSYRDVVGTYYTLGYDMTAYARYRYGADVWDKTLSSYVSRPISFWPASDAFRRQTGIRFGRLFDETFRFLRGEWEARDSGYVIPVYLSGSHRRYTSLQYPQSLNDSTIVCIRSGIGDISSVVSIVGGRERRLAYTTSVTGKLQVEDSRGRIYWTETVSGLRWTHEGFTMLRYMEGSANRVRTFAPSYTRIIQFAASPNVVALSLMDEGGDSRIALVDVDSFRETGSIAVPDGSYVKDLTWGDEGMLYASAVSADGVSLHSIDTASGSWKAILEGTRANVTGLAWKEGRLLFESGLDGLNNIYSLNLSDRTARKLTNSRFGAFQPNVSGDRLIFADYQPEGYRIATLPLDSLPGMPANFSEPYRFALAEALSSQEPMQLSADSLLPVDFHPTPYRKAAHLFNIHSWAPFYYNLNDVVSRNTDAFLTSVKPGVTLISQNSLNTAIGQMAWYYAEGYHHGVFQLTYMGWLPVLSFRADVGDRAYDMIWKTNDQDEMILGAVQTSRPSLDIEANAYVPLTSNRGGYIRGLRPSISWIFANDRYQQYRSKRTPYIQYVKSEVHLYAYRRMSAQDLLPRIGFQLRLQQIHMPFQPDNIGDLYGVRLTGYLPGIVRTHSLMLRAGWQYQNVNGKALYNFNRLIDAPRGHSAELRTQHQAILQADYAFPIVTPDISLGSLAYVRRIRANLFADLGLNRTKASAPWDKPRMSYGSDILFDWNVLRMSYSLQTGVRILQPVGFEKMRFQLLSSISF